MRNLFLVVKTLPENMWYKHLALMLGALLGVSMLVLCVVMLLRSRKRYRYCPKCRSATEIGWRTEHHGLSNPRFRAGRKGIRFDVGVEKIAVIRCPGCGWEIDLGK